jgi:carboxyl-terminal processing protease
MNRTTAVFLLACLTLGFLIGINMPRTETTYIISSTGNKLDEVFGIINASYVDSTDIDSLIEKSIPRVLEELDPHSVYIAAKDVEESNADLQSSFSGIGIRFTIQDDTLRVSDIIRGGPSEKVGMLAGDRIIKVNDTLFVGKGVCTNDAALKKLKGPKGSFVKIAVERYGEKDLLDFNIRRDDIPMESIEAAYMIDQWGYVQVERFAENTYAEFIRALAHFMACNAKGIIIDLRGNGGGYLGIALEMANQFLKKDDVIVYTEGVNSPKKIERANGYGMFQQTPIVVLVDETSASASEIIAGTIQDNDRGTVIGRRTFGKGLVQQPFDLADGSAMRLTIARYHTPSGRCIQKPYDKGGNDKYAMDLIDRYNRGEFFSQDSIHFNDSLIYKTRNGRTVYGGGGIMPDIFVSSDTVDMTPYSQEAFSRGLITRFALSYSDRNRRTLSQFKTHEAMTAHLNKQGIVEEFISYAEQKGLKPNTKDIAKSRKIMQRALNSNIIYQMIGMLEHVKYINLEDPTVLKAVEVLENGEAYPKAPGTEK